MTQVYRPVPGGHQGATSGHGRAEPSPERPLPHRTLWCCWGNLRALLRVAQHGQRGLPKWKSRTKCQQQKNVCGNSKEKPQEDPQKRPCVPEELSDGPMNQKLHFQGSFTQRASGGIPLPMAGESLQHL